MFFNQSDEICRRVSCQCGFGEVRVGGDKVFRLTMQVGEVAASAAGNQYLLTDAPGAFQPRHAPSAFARLDGAHESSGPATEDDDVKVVFHDHVSRSAMAAALRR